MKGNDTHFSPTAHKANESRRLHNEKGPYEWLIFAAAIVTGTACSILSKVLYETTDATSHHKFNKPIFQTLAMFIAMILGLPFHWAVIYFKIPFPGYDRFCSATDGSSAHDGSDGSLFVEEDLDRTPRTATHKAFRQGDEEMQKLVPPSTKKVVSDDDNGTRITLKTYFYLMVPALFDCVATVLCMFGLLFLDVSIYQLLRGSGIIFVALLRQYYLQEHLFAFQWIGVGWNAVSVMLIGATALLDSSHSDEDSSLEKAMTGVPFMLAGSLVQSMMFVFEEKVMNLDEVSFVCAWACHNKHAYLQTLSMFWLSCADKSASFAFVWNGRILVRPSIILGFPKVSNVLIMCFLVR